MSRSRSHSHEPPLPTFLIIGAQRSGTRWLRINMGRHPDIFTAVDEIAFFNYGRRVKRLGLDWYRDRFHGWNGEPIIGEATPAYMLPRHDPVQVAKRIDATLAGVKVIALVRNPVERANSSLLEHISRGRLPEETSLVAVAADRAPEVERLAVIDAGRYASILRPYLDRFGERLLVMLYDDIVSDPAGVLRRALTHVGAAPEHIPEDVDAVWFSNQHSEDEPSHYNRAGARYITNTERLVVWKYFDDEMKELSRLTGLDLARWAAVENPKTRAHRERYVALLRRVSVWVAGLLDGTQTEHGNQPTPCAEWNVTDLVAHIAMMATGAARGFRSMRTHGELAPGFVPIDPRADAATRFRTGLANLISHFEEPLSFSGRAKSAILGDLEVPDLAEMTLLNLVTHGWDLAVATDQDSTIPKAVADAVLSRAETTLAALPDRGFPYYQRPVPVEDDAATTERLMAMVGRSPSQPFVTSARS